MDDVFKALKAIMLPMAKSLDITKDETGHLDVYTFHKMKNGKPMWFGGVRIQKKYVSYYLMPIYVNPELLQGMSPDLKKRMTGKSCFNFKEVQKIQFDELKLLTQKGFQDYQLSGYILQK